jgi:hypothetical protein
LFVPGNPVSAIRESGQGEKKAHTNSVAINVFQQINTQQRRLLGLTTVTASSIMVLIWSQG